VTAYYNEIDRYAAAWLQSLINAGHIAPGVVDTRSIEDVTPNDIAGFTQCHFFAGIGVWSYALRRAGWPDDRPVWTGSCPCQPFSSAGKGAGFDDERHLWPAFQYLIEQRRPQSVFGEQVASKDADVWIDLVHTDLEALGYAFGAVPFPSAGIGAPHIRDRLYWVGNTYNEGSQGHGRHGEQPFPQGREGTERYLGATSCEAFGLGNTLERNPDKYALLLGQESGRVAANSAETSGGSEAVSGMADAASDGYFATSRSSHVRRMEQRQGRENRQNERVEFETERGAEFGGLEWTPTGPTNGFWRDADWLGCRDGKFWPVRPGSFPLVDGASSRVGRLRAYGNAINAEAAISFIEAFLADEITRGELYETNIFNR